MWRSLKWLPAAQKVDGTDRNSTLYAKPHTSKEQDEQCEVRQRKGNEGHNITVH